MDIITLTPYAVGNGHYPDLEFNDPIVLIGDGSLTDGDDATGVQMGASTAAAGTDHHGEPLALYFKTPAGFNPFAIALQARMKNDPFVLGASPDGPRWLETLLWSSDGATLFATDRSTSSLSTPLVDILIPATTAPTDFTWWADLPPPDMVTPESAIGWFQLDWDYNVAAGDKAALAGSGLRIDLALYFDTVDVGVRYAWIDWLEVALLVSGTYVSTQAPPCHLYPRDDSLGVGSGAIWPPPSSGRPGGYY